MTSNVSSEIDLTVLIVFAMAAYSGYRRGFITEMSDFFILLVAVGLSIVYSTRLADWLVLEHGMVTLSARVVAPLSIYLVVQGVGSLILFLVYRRIPEAIRDSGPNKVSGIFAGLLKAVGYGAAVFCIVAAVPLDGARNAMRESWTGPPLAAVGDTVARVLGLDLNQTVGRAFQRLMVSNHPHGHESIPISPITDEWRLRVQPSQEEALLAMVNDERHKQHLAPLVMDEPLRAVARAHSKDMWMRGYFGHVDPDHKDLADRVRAANIPFTLVGENIALAPTLEMAHDGLMQSPDHRANILNPRFKRAGMGIYLGGSEGIMVTQNFGN